MTISSRTPEGLPTFCPLCMANVVVEPSVFIGDAICPRCGQLLWFIQTSETTQFFATEQTSKTRERIIDIVADHLGVDREKVLNNAELLNDLGADSLGAIELIMKLEED